MDETTIWLLIAQYVIERLIEEREATDEEIKEAARRRKELLKKLKNQQ